MYHKEIYIEHQQSIFMLEIQRSFNSFSGNQFICHKAFLQVGIEISSDEYINYIASIEKNSRGHSYCYWDIAIYVNW